MDPNPYVPPVTSASSSSAVDSYAMGNAIRFAVFTYLVALIAFALLGCFLWLFTFVVDTIRYGQGETFGRWWFLRAGFLIDGPLMIGSAIFVWFATKRTVNGYVALAVVVVASVLEHILLDTINMASPRHSNPKTALLPVHPLFYPVEIWGAILPCVVASAGMIICSKLVTKAEQPKTIMDEQTIGHEALDQPH